MEGIHLRSEVTWNKPMPPEFHAEVRKTFSLLSSIVIFCGVGALAAVVLGCSWAGAGRRSGCCRASRQRRSRSFCGST